MTALPATLPFILGITTPPGTPLARTKVVQKDWRTATIPADDRTFIVPTDD